MVIAISNAHSSYSESLQSYSYIRILVKLRLTCDTTTAVLAVLRYNYTCTTIQLQPYYDTDNYGRTTYHTTTVLRQSYLRNTVQLLLRYTVITLHYVNFLLTPTVHMYGRGHCNKARRDINQPNKAILAPKKPLVSLRGWF